MKLTEIFKWKKYASFALVLFASVLFTGCPDGDDDVLPPSLELNPKEINFSNEKGETRQFTITTGSDVEWKIDDSECSDWLSVDIKQAKGSMTVTLKTIKENKKARINVKLVVTATNSVSETSAEVSITRDAGISEAYARQAEPFVILSYGMGCVVEVGDMTSYFRYNVYTAKDFAALEGNDDLIAKDAETNSSWTRQNVQSNGGGNEIIWDKCSPATNYVFVTVAYDRENNRGEVNTFPFVTKDAKEENQPRVKVEPKKYTIEEVHDSNNGPWYKWDTNTDGKGTFYLTYACASDRMVETMLEHNNNFGTIDNTIGTRLAWNIFMESKKDNLESAREVSFNKDNSSGREKLFGKTRNNSTQWIEFRNTDKYLQIVTWAFKDNDFNTYSGVLSSVLYHVDNGELREVSASTEYYVNVSPSTLRFGATPDEANAIIDSNDSWTLSSNQSWCRIDGEQVKKGSGSKKVTVSVIQNESSSASREAKITVTGDNSTSTLTITVTQDAKVTTVFGLDDYDADKDLDGDQIYTLQVSPQSMNFSSAGGSNSVTVKSNDNWTVKSDQTWCSVSKGSGSNDGNFIVTATKNNTTTARSAFITVRGSNSGSQTISVTQDAGSVVGIDDFDTDKDLNEGVSYYMVIKTPEKGTDFDATGGECVVTIDSNDSWTVSSDQSWCTISNSSGSNSGSFRITVSKNTTSMARSAMVRIKGAHVGTDFIEVTQDAGVNVGRDDYDGDKPL